MSDCFWKPLRWDGGNGDWMMMSPLYTVLQAQRTLNIKEDYHDYSDGKNHSSLSASLFPLSPTAHPDLSSEGKSNGRQPGSDRPRETPSKPPSVKVIGGLPSASWPRPWSLALLFAALCLQWTLFWCQWPLWMPPPPSLPPTSFKEPHTCTETLISFTKHPYSCPQRTCMDGSAGEMKMA